MKLPFKVLFINLGLVVIISLLLLVGINSSFRADDFFIAFGLVALVAAVIDLIIGIVMLATGNKESGKGFMLSTGVLLLIGFASCGMGLNSMTFH